jgi:O-succinylbenzoate synthase
MDCPGHCLFQKRAKNLLPVVQKIEMDLNEKIPIIDKAEIIIVGLPLLNPFVTSFAREIRKEALLVNLVSGNISGWGECVASPAPYYSYETNETVQSIIKNFLLPLLKIQANQSLSEFLNKTKKIRGHNMAKATVENALLDLMARQKKIPLYELIGGQDKRIMSGISIGIKDDLKELLNTVENARDKKYHRIKIKIKKGKDIEIINAVRESFPEIRLMVDANADYSYEDLNLLKQFDQFDLMMIEQPLPYDDLYFHSLVQKAIQTPLCLDESVKNLQDAKTAVTLSSCQIINIKQGRVGGILASRSIQEYCLSKNLDCWSGGMLETGIGRTFNLHLQTLPGFTLPGDTSETSRYFAEDIVDKPVVLDEKGYIDIPRGPGTGVEVMPEKLKKFTLYREKLL